MPSAARALFLAAALAGPVSAQAAADWSAWDDVEIFRGRYEARRIGGIEQHVPHFDETAREEDVVTLDFEIERKTGRYVGSDWRIVRSLARGSSTLTHREEGTWDKLAANSSASYSGPVADGDIGFALDTKAGTWEFGVNGRMKEPYVQVSSYRQEKGYGGGRWETESWEESAQKSYYAHGGKRLPLPGPKPGPLSATWESKEQTDPARGDTTWHDYRWRVSLSPVWPDYEVIVKVEGVGPKGEATPYEEWLPQGTRDGGVGARLKVTARLQSRDGKPVHASVKEFRFELRDTSTEPGVALNWPFSLASNAAPASRFDLSFDQVSGRTDAGRQLLTVEPRKDREGRPFAEAGIDCRDYGAWATLVVGAELTDGRQIAGHLEEDSYASDIPLPKRAGLSFIASAWKSSQGTGAEARDEGDEEQEPEGDGYAGDGLTLYEEYRGFFENGVHRRGEPGKKDYFVVNIAGLDGQLGIKHFERISGLRVRGDLDPLELDPATRIINRHHDRGPHTVDQHGVIMAFHNEEGYSAAFGGPGTPAQITHVGIIRSSPATPTTIPGMSFRVASIAHELLHTVNVWHHGEEDQTVYWWAKDGVLYEDLKTGDNERAGREVGIRVSREDDADITRGMTRRLEGRFVVVHKSLPHGQHSGFENCLMRYAAAEMYPAAAERNVRFIGFQEIKGTRLCADPAGTGVNAEGRRPQSRYSSAHAGRGSCRAQIRVSDREPPPSRAY